MGEFLPRTVFGKPKAGTRDQDPLTIYDRISQTMQCFTPVLTGGFTGTRLDQDSFMEIADSGESCTECRGEREDGGIFNFPKHFGKYLTPFRSHIFLSIWKKSKENSDIEI